ncbi:transferrin-binding protein-like solute binding protein [Sphingomonas yabuuchiae]|uniref:transferrin-binding protein-like solute binding protein n=1 Tax=Sphingomonas yabuuchiae TaxID=172044 RepID=UPI003D9A02F2
MRGVRALPLAASVMLGTMLSACGGGGGGGVNSTPTPPPATPVNTTLTDLKASQSFTNDAATQAIVFEQKTSTVISGQKTSAALTVRYDVTTNSYAITLPDRTVTFGQADIQDTSTEQTRYLKSSDTARDRLTLVKIPYTGKTANDYVGLGYYQRNVSADGRQNTEFATFTYGLDTPAASVPRMGLAAFRIDVFGLSATPGYEARQFQGQGKFSVDFGAGIFSASSYLNEYELVSGSGSSGGGIELTATGRLSASDGTFGGNMLYGGFQGTIPGQLSGRFYGPTGQELGASFSGQNASTGASVTGSFTGQRDSTIRPDNLSLTNMSGEQLFYVSAALLTTRVVDGQSGLGIGTYSMIGQLNRLNDETFTYGPGLSNLPGGGFTINDKIASSDPNFTAYRKTFDGQEVKLELYRPGSGNTELALTYASLGRWSTSNRVGTIASNDRVYLAYGLDTPRGLMAAKTGTGRYDGVVYGAGANSATGATYDVKGTSRFDVDFSNQRYSGSLALKGTGINGAAAVDFGRYEFSDRMGWNGTLGTTGLSTNGARAGDVSSRFYGPDGQEIGSTFTLTTPAGASGAGTTISGASVAKRQ